MSDGVMFVNWRGRELEVSRSYLIFWDIVVGSHLFGGALEKSLRRFRGPVWG